MKFEEIEERLFNFKGKSKEDYVALRELLISYCGTYSNDSYFLANLILDNNDGSEEYREQLITLLPLFYYNKILWVNKIRKALNNDYLVLWASSKNILHKHMFELLSMGGFKDSMDIYFALLRNPDITPAQHHYVMYKVEYELSQMNKSNRNYKRYLQELSDIVNKKEK